MKPDDIYKFKTLGSHSYLLRLLLQFDQGRQEVAAQQVSSCLADDWLRVDWGRKQIRINSCDFVKFSFVNADIF